MCECVFVLMCEREKEGEGIRNLCLKVTENVFVDCGLLLQCVFKFLTGQNQINQ